MNILVRLLIGAIAGAIAGLIVYRTMGAEPHTPDRGPHPEWIRGFEQGVRWGLIARIQYPDEDSIPALTEHAKSNYYYLVVDRDRTISNLVHASTNRVR